MDWEEKDEVKSESACSASEMAKKKMMDEDEDEREWVKKERKERGEGELDEVVQEKVEIERCSKQNTHASAASSKFTIILTQC